MSGAHWSRNLIDVSPPKLLKLLINDESLEHGAQKEEGREGNVEDGMSYSYTQAVKL